MKILTLAVSLYITACTAAELDISPLKERTKDDKKLITWIFISNSQRGEVFRVSYNSAYDRSIILPSDRIDLFRKNVDTRTADILSKNDRDALNQILDKAVSYWAENDRRFRATPNTFRASAPLESTGENLKFQLQGGADAFSILALQARGNSARVREEETTRLAQEGREAERRSKATDRTPAPTRTGE